MRIVTHPERRTHLIVCSDAELARVQRLLEAAPEKGPADAATLFSIQAARARLEDPKA
jgi:hypothetical protein